MKIEYAIRATQIKKKFKGFELDIPECHIPKGFATALIGENGAGKTTFLNILAGIRLDYKGSVEYLREHETDVEKSEGTNWIHWTGKLFPSQLDSRPSGEDQSSVV